MAEGRQSVPPLSTEETERDDAAENSKRLMRGNQESFMSDRRRPSTERSVLVALHGKREREPGLDSDTATLSFISSFGAEGGDGAPCKKPCLTLESAGYAQRDKNQQNYHWEVDVDRKVLKLCRGNVPLPGNDLQSYFKYDTCLKRLTVLNDSFTVILDTRNLKLLVQPINHQTNPTDPIATDVQRIHIPIWDEFVFFFDCNQVHYPIRADFDNMTLVVDEVKEANFEKAYYDETYRWKKVPE